MFTERPSSQGIFYVGNKRQMKHEIAHGDSVTLKLGERFVAIRKVHLKQPHGYTGEIVGFEPADTEEYRGIKVGERVDFSELQVYGCSSGS